MRSLAIAVLLLSGAFLLGQEAPPPTSPQTAQPPAPSTPAAQPAKKQTPRQEAWELLRTGAQNKSTERRVKAIGVLGLIPNNSEARHYAEAALQDSDSSVRVAAATALGDMESKQSIPLLKERLDDDDTSVVLACAKALLQMKEDAGYEVYYAVLTGQRKATGSMVSEQMKVLHDPKKLAQIGIEEGVGFVPFAGMGYTAIKMLSKDDVSPVRAAAARALANDPDPETGKALSEAVGDKSWIVRKAALDAVAKRGDPKLLKPVIAAMEDEKEIVMYTAAAAVVHLTDARVRQNGKHHSH